MSRRIQNARTYAARIRANRRRWALGYARHHVDLYRKLHEKTVTKMGATFRTVETYRDTVWLTNPGGKTMFLAYKDTGEPVPSIYYCGEEQ